MGKFHQFLTELSARDRSVFYFPDDNKIVNINGFSLHLVCALILGRSGLGLLIEKFLTDLCARDTSAFFISGC